MLRGTVPAHSEFKHLDALPGSRDVKWCRSSVGSSTKVSAVAQRYGVEARHHRAGRQASL